MLFQAAGSYLRVFLFLICFAIPSIAAAAEFHGQVMFGSVPVPGATVTLIQGTNRFSTSTDQQGFFSFPDLANGEWTIEVSMQGFATTKQDLEITADTPAAQLELKMLPLDEIKADPQSTASTAAPASSPPGTEAAAKPAEKNTADQAAPPTTNQDERASEGFLINGSENNGAASPFGQIAAFGNNRNGVKSLYNGGVGIIIDNSALNANAFSLSGLSTSKPVYNQVTGVATIGGPIRIPHLIRNGPFFFVGYQWTRNGNDTTQSALVPTLAERMGDFSQTMNALGQPVQIFNSATGMPFSGNIPISPQAQALLNLYPTPNISGNPRYNYQIPIISNMHQDAMQMRINKFFNRKDQLFGGFAFVSTRSSDPNLFGFLDVTDLLGLNANVNWSHRIGEHFFQSIGFQYSRLATRVTPYWENRENISGDAGIMGNNQEPANWGPPSLAFSSGVAGLSDSESSHDRNQTSALSYSLFWNHRSHNFTFGGDFRRQEFNYLSQQNPRGIFTFTGAATEGIVNGELVGGSDLADFELGIPDTSAIAFGNADKYFRESVYDAFITDDWRLSPQLSINVGFRWDYGAPITELDGRLVNLDTAPGFGAVAPVVGNAPVGPLTGQSFPSSLIRPDRRGFAPRVGLSWRPISGQSWVVRAGYGIYYDTSVYQSIALLMAQQAPLSTSLQVQNSAACPLTLAHGFNSCPLITPDLFGVDPNFRVGYAQSWQLSVQRDLPASLQLTVTALRLKGTRGVQEYLPNTYPVGAANPCPACPVGFAFLASNGDSTRNAGQVQLRRRLHNGLTAALLYTYSKSMDDDSALGGQATSAFNQTAPGPVGSGTTSQGATVQNSNQGAFLIAQNWLDLNAERGLSTFDHRHLLNLQLEYTTGTGLGGHTLSSGKKAALFKEWTVVTVIAVGTGLPQTPIYLASVPGTGVTGSIRPDYTGADIYASPSGLYLNPAAYSAPLLGQWGNAGRDSITGPSQFTMNASIARTFRLKSRFNLDLRFDSTNILNRVTFTTWDTVINSTQFGLPVAANQMRTVKTTLRLRF